MRLFFLGTGPAEGLPALFCECALCTEARRRGGRDLRTRASVIIDEAIRIDLPPDTLAQAHRYPELPLHRVRYLLFTHSHDDHYAIRELQYLSPTFAPARKCPLNIWLTKYCQDQLLPVADRFFEQAPVVLNLVEPYQSYTVGHLTATPIVAHHKDDELCLNYLLSETPDTPALLYGSDTGWYSEETWEYLSSRRLRGVVLECGNGTQENGYPGHLSIEGCLRTKARLEASGALPPGAPFYLTHISHAGGLPHDVFEERVARFGIRVAYDGLDIEI